MSHVDVSLSISLSLPHDATVSRTEARTMGEPATIPFPAPDDRPPQEPPPLPGQQTLPFPAPRPTCSKPVGLGADTSASGSAAPTLREVWEAFEGRFVRQVEEGERSGRSLKDYQLAARDLLEVLGRETPINALRPADFGRLRARLAERLAKKTLKNRINAVRTILASAGELRDEAGNRRFTGTPDYGREFDRPSLRSIRRERQQKGSYGFEPAEIRRLLAAAREPLATMVLLGINGGLGNTDVAQLPWGVVDLDAGWLDFPRPKTGEDRRIPLWTETVAALKAQRQRLYQTGPHDLVFRTRQGNAWVRTETDGQHVDALTKEFAKVRGRAGIEKPVGFYGLRHAFQTIGEESGDKTAVSAIMGHVDPSISAIYREKISDPRLRGVVDVVHTLVFDDG